MFGCSNDYHWMGHGEGWHADNASAGSMTGWEPIVVKPLIILRQIKTVETERDALLRPSEERHPSGIACPRSDEITKSVGGPRSRQRLNIAG